jgi:hypothetical protein
LTSKQRRVVQKSRPVSLRGRENTPGMPKSRPVTLLGRENTPGNAEIAPKQAHRARKHAWECRNRARPQAAAVVGNSN